MKSFAFSFLLVLSFSLAGQDNSAPISHQAYAKEDSLTWQRAISEPVLSFTKYRTTVDTVPCSWMTYAGSDGLVHYAENIPIERTTVTPVDVVGYPRYESRPLGLPGCRRVIMMTFHKKD